MDYLKQEDDYIINGFRNGNASIIREYFYGYCEVGYNIFDKRYGLREKENLDFMSLAHQYALYLMEHDWKPLEDRSPGVSLRTWIINGFRYVVLDALKWYKKEYGSITFEDYLRSFDCHCDWRLQFNNVVEGLCRETQLSRQDRLIIDLLLLKGYKGKEVAEMMAMTPSAVSQRYKKLKDDIVVPYLKNHFDMELDMPEVMEDRAAFDMDMPAGIVPTRELTCFCMPESESSSMDMGVMSIFSRKRKARRTTPEVITALRPNEIFVFGSNLRGLHGGGAAYMAFSRFGAVMGQGVGLQGQSYGIPTMQGGMETIRPYVDDFIAFAKQHQEWTFLVTRIGCGLAGFSDDDISPLFEKAHGLDNVVLPEGW